MTIEKCRHGEKLLESIKRIKNKSMFGEESTEKIKKNMTLNFQNLISSTQFSKTRTIIVLMSKDILSTKNVASKEKMIENIYLCPN